MNNYNETFPDKFRAQYYKNPKGWRYYLFDDKGRQVANNSADTLGIGRNRCHVSYHIRATSSSPKSKD